MLRGGSRPDFDVAPDISEMESLMSQLQPPGSSSVTECICSGDELAVCSEFDNKQWEEQFLESLAPSTASVNVESEPEDEVDLEPPAPKLKNLGEAICNLEDVRQFLDSKGYASQATSIASAVDMVTSLHCQCLQLHGSIRKQMELCC